MKIGILDLQGGVHEHRDHLERLGIFPVCVKKEKDFEDLVGLIIPGGESTCLSRLIRNFGLETIIREKHQSGMKIWGTCAGAILVANSIAGEKPHLQFIDITVQRNAFGSQLDSFNTTADIPSISNEPIPLTFIRAPKIIEAGHGVTVLLRINNFIAAAESKNVLATVFHPELTPSLAFHKYFAQKCGLKTTDPKAQKWDRKSWMRHAKI